MVGKVFFFLLGLLAATMAQESSVDVKSDLDLLKSMIDDGDKSVLHAVDIIADAPRDFKALTDERVGCLIWEHTAQKKATNKTISEAVLKGMMKNKPFTSYQCVSKASQELLDKLDTMEPYVPVSSEKIREKALTPVRALGLILPGFSDFCKDFYKQKSAELNKTGDAEGRKKILHAANEKMKFLKTLMQQVEDFVKSARFKFLEEHINFAFQVENNVRKVQKEGAQKILKCVN